MAASYPGAVKTFVNPTATDTLNSATVPHYAQHANANDEISAIESTLGVNPQGSYASVVARLNDTVVQSTINAKGDLLVGTANDALTNVTVGTNGQVLVADSTQTAGVKWTGTPALGAGSVITSPVETWNVVAAAATGTINIDAVTAGVWYYTTSASANFTLNFRGNSTTTLASILATGQAITVVFVNTNGATGYYATAYQIDGNAVTPKWVGSAPSAGNANALDVYTFTIVKTAATPSYTVLAQFQKAA